MQWGKEIHSAARTQGFQRHWLSLLSIVMFQTLRKLKVSNSKHQHSDPVLINADIWPHTLQIILSNKLLPTETPLLPS